MRRGIDRRLDGTYRVRLPSQEREVLASLPEQLREALTAEAFDPDPIASGYLGQLDANFAQPHTLTTFTSEGRDLDGTADLSPRGIKIPILIIHGDGDQLVPLGVGEGLHRQAPGSQLWVVPHGSHMLPVTHAAALADRIAAFGAEKQSDL